MPRSHSQFVEEPGFDLRQSSSDTVISHNAMWPTRLSPKLHKPPHHPLPFPSHGPSTPTLSQIHTHTGD